jgi:hypothetical protein
MFTVEKLFASALGAAMLVPEAAGSGANLHF